MSATSKEEEEERHGIHTGMAPFGDLILTL
jgi:hypothetical protein